MAVDPPANTSMVDPAFQEVLEQYEAELAIVQEIAERTSRALRRRTRGELDKVLQRAIAEGRLDDAVLIRDKIRQLQMPLGPVLENVHNMGAYANQIGNSYLVLVRGDGRHGVYGTDIYTYDSLLSARSSMPEY
jgi:hypothetical protein